MASTLKAQLFKKNVKRVAIVFRPDTTNALKMARELSVWLKKRKIEVLCHPKQKISPDIKKVQDPKALDMVIVLGGDGTYLHAVRMIEGARVPMLGVNLGSLGFLTIHRAQDLYDLVEMAINGELELKSRSMIHLEVKRSNKSKQTTTQTMCALNDLVIERGPNSHLIHLGISADGMQINDVKADGLIIATPTGSTAYNLAAGGPILHPEVNALVVTPVCPHSLTSRPFIFPDGRKISFHLLGKSSRAMLTVDGSKVAMLTAKDEVTVEREPCDHLILRRPSHNFFTLLREKLKFGDRG